MTTTLIESLDKEFLHMWYENIDRQAMFDVAGPTARMVVTNEEFFNCMDDFLHDL